MRVALDMHINHRRKNKPPIHWRSTHTRWGYPMGLYTYKPMRKASWRLRRAQAKALMDHGRYDMLPRRYPRDILWNYW